MLLLSSLVMATKMKPHTKSATASASGKSSSELPKEWIRVSAAIEFSGISKTKLQDLTRRSLKTILKWLVICSWVLRLARDH